jgi:hypothetical protein
MVAISPLLTVFTIVVAVMAFLEAQDKGRVFLIVSMSLTFLLPRIFPSITMTILCFVSRIMIAVGCLIYLKWQGGIFSK